MKLKGNKIVKTINEILIKNTSRITSIPSIVGKIVRQVDRNFFRKLSYF